MNPRKIGIGTENGNETKHLKEKAKWR